MSKLANRWPKKKIREWLRRNLQCPTKSRVLSSMIQFHLNFQSSLSSLPRWHLERFQCRSSAQFPVRLIFFSVSRRNLIPDGPLTGLSRFDNPVLSPGLVNSKGTSSSSHSGLSWSVPISTFSSFWRSKRWISVRSPGLVQLVQLVYSMRPVRFSLISFSLCSSNKTLRGPVRFGARGGDPFFYYF